MVLSFFLWTNEDFCWISGAAAENITGHETTDRPLLDPSQHRPAACSCLAELQQSARYEMTENTTPLYNKYAAYYKYLANNRHVSTRITLGPTETSRFNKGRWLFFSLAGCHKGCVCVCNNMQWQTSDKDL